MNGVFAVAELDRQLESRVSQKFPKATVGWRDYRSQALSGKGRCICMAPM